MWEAEKKEKKKQTTLIKVVRQHDMERRGTPLLNLK